MSYSINTIPQFDKQIKRLSNKYPSLFISDFKLFVEGIKLNPLQGKQWVIIASKIHLAIHQKGKGKSGGVRIITHLLIENKLVYFPNHI